jgi:hypothetical protein
MNEALAESLTMGGIILARTFGQQRFFFDRFTCALLSLNNADIPSTRAVH